jgi:hypothetical protein
MRRKASGNSHVKVTEPHDVSPIVVVQPGDVVWLSGTIKPNYEDWELPKSTESTENQFFARVLTRDQDGEYVQGDWEQVKLVGVIPNLK